MANDYDYDRDGERSDRDDDRPRRDRRGYRDGYDEPPTKQVSVLGVLGLVEGIVSLLVSLVPCIGAFGIIGAAFGLLLGAIGLVLARKSEGRVGTGLPIAAVSVNLVGIVVASIWVVLLAAVWNNKPDAKDMKEQPDAVATGPGDIGNPALTVSAADLDREYDDNEPAADTKYKGKWIEVNGKVARVTGDTHPRKMTLELNAGTTVDCVFGLDKKADLATLKVGEQVTVRGKCKGKVKGSVTLEDCARTAREPEKAVEPPPGEVVRVPADELHKAFDENVVAADGKYKGKVIEVTGKVDKVQNADRGKITLRLRVEDEAAGFAIVNCEFLAKDAPQLAALKNGQSVVIRGKCVGLVDGFGPVTLELCSVVK